MQPYPKLGNDNQKKKKKNKEKNPKKPNTKEQK